MQHVQLLIDRAKQSQQKIEYYSQRQIDRMLQAIVWSCCQDSIAKSIAEEAVQETGMGNIAGKYLKMSVKIRAALFDILPDASVGIIESIPERNLVKIAKPVGVIAAIAPCTNCEATPVIKTINAIKGRNSVVLAPHPRAKKINFRIVQLMRQALTAIGEPADLIQTLEQPSIEDTKYLMQHSDLVLATGGAAMVKAAYTSGTPALGVGVGNAVITVDHSAEIAFAAEKIAFSKTLDMSTSCSSDNAVLAFDVIYDQLLKQLQHQGGYLVSPQQKQAIANVLWHNGTLNPKVLARPVQKLCVAAGFEVADDRKFIIVPCTEAGSSELFSGEKMAPVLALYRVSNIAAAIAMTNNIQNYQGSGHSCGIYSHNNENIQQLALQTKTSRVMVNQPQAASNSGNLWNGMRQTFSLGCGFWGGNSSNENINWRHLVNITYVSKPLKHPKKLPPDSELFKDVL